MGDRKDLKCRIALGRQARLRSGSAGRPVATTGPQPHRPRCVLASVEERKLEIPTICSSSIPLLRQRLQRISRALEANSSTSLRLRHASRAPDLHTSTSPRLHVCSEPSELQSSIPLRLHVYTLAARLQSSGASYLFASTSARS